MKPKGHSSMVSLPGSILGDDDKSFQQFAPNYGQENNGDFQQNNGHNNGRPSQPPRPPPRVQKKAPPPRPNQNGYQPQQIGGHGGLPPIHQNQVMDMSMDNYNQNQNGNLASNNNNVNNYHQNQSGQRLSISDPMNNKPLPEEPPEDNDNHNQQNQNENSNNNMSQVQNNMNGDGVNQGSQPQKRRVVRADPNMRPWDNKPKNPPVNNEPVGLEYGHKDVNASWQCAVCTYQNTNSVVKCSMCGLPNKPNKPQNQRPNDEDDDIYEDPNGLGGPRPKPAGDNAQSKWQCKV